MGVSDSSILNSADKFQKTRNKIIHETSFMDNGEIKIAQHEAVVAHKIYDLVSKCVII